MKLILDLMTKLITLGSYGSYADDVVRLVSECFNKGYEEGNANKDMRPLLLEMGPVFEYLEDGEKIKAIKYVRDSTGASLKSAKDFVDTVQREIDRAVRGCSVRK